MDERGWRKIAQSNRMCYRYIKMDGVGGRIMMDERGWRKIAQSRMNVLRQYQDGWCGFRTAGAWFFVVLTVSIHLSHRWCLVFCNTNVLILCNLEILKILVQTTEYPSHLPSFHSSYLPLFHPPSSTHPIFHPIAQHTCN